SSLHLVPCPAPSDQPLEVLSSHGVQSTSLSLHLTSLLLRSQRVELSYSKISWRWRDRLREMQSLRQKGSWTMVRIVMLLYIARSCVRVWSSRRNGLISPRLPLKLDEDRDRHDWTGGNQIIIETESEKSKSVGNKST